MDNKKDVEDNKRVKKTKIFMENGQYPMTMAIIKATKVGEDGRMTGEKINQVMSKQCGIFY